jgi:hypothetical protein
MSEEMVRCINPQSGGPGDFGFLPLALNKSMSNCGAAVLVMFHHGYFISPVPTISGERSLICHPGRRIWDKKV